MMDVCQIGASFTDRSSQFFMGMEKNKVTLGPFSCISQVAPKHKNGSSHRVVCQHLLVS